MSPAVPACLSIRPGAPTSSIDISVSGNVGIGTASPAFPLDVTNSNASVARFKSTAAANVVNITLDAASIRNANIEYQQGGTNKWFEGNVASNDRFRLTNSTANCNAEVFSIFAKWQCRHRDRCAHRYPFSERHRQQTRWWNLGSFFGRTLEEHQGPLQQRTESGHAVTAIRYEYKQNNVLGLKSEGEYVGFGAQAVQKIIPEAVSKSAEGYLMVNSDPILWTMLNAIKEQQKEIAELKGQIRKLQATSRRHRK
jgi:hypothetical protein